MLAFEPSLSSQKWTLGYRYTRTAAVGFTSRPPLVHAMFVALFKYRLLSCLAVAHASQGRGVTRNLCRRRPPVVSAVYALPFESTVIVSKTVNSPVS